MYPGLILPSEILFKVGESEKIFNIGTVDNSEVEGERVITITSQIKFEGCSCVDSNDPTTSISQNLTIIDNDGLALSLKISPSTIKAGATNNTLTISRNTNDPNILQNPVTINISSDLSNIVQLPNSAIIPANQKEVEVTFNTIIDPNQTNDENVRIQADADSYTSGFGWLLVSNQNKPDGLISEITTNTNVEAGTKIAVSSFIKNQGNIDFPTKSKIDYYLSKTENINNTTPFVSSIVNKAIEVDETYEYVEELQLPNVSGDFHLIAVINADYAISELDYENNQNETSIKILPAYTVDISLNNVQYFQLNTGNPDTEKAISRKRKSEEPIFVGDRRNKESIKQTEDEKYPKLKDFYTKRDEFKVDELDRENYQDLKDRLSKDELALLNSGKHFYQMDFENIGGLVMPIILEFEFEDGTTEKKHIPAHIWQKDNFNVSKVFIFKKKLIGVKVDPELETADTDFSNNSWPHQAQPSRFQLFQEREYIGNPMQRDKEYGK